MAVCLGVVVLSYAVGYIYIYIIYIYIYIPGQLGFGFFYYCAVFWCAQIIEYIMAWRSYSFVYALHYLIITIIQIRYWTSKILQGYILSSVCLRLSQFSQLSLMQYVGLCVFSLPIYLMMIVIIHVLYLIIMKSGVWLICHCLWLGHETMVCAVCFSIFVFRRIIRNKDYGYASNTNLTKTDHIKTAKQRKANVCISYLACCNLGEIREYHYYLR